MDLVDPEKHGPVFFIGKQSSNPFKYETVAFGEDFANRKNELGPLTSKLKQAVRSMGALMPIFH